MAIFIITCVILAYLWVHGGECAYWLGPGLVSAFEARVGVCTAYMVWVGSEREVAPHRKTEVLSPERGGGWLLGKQKL